MIARAFGWARALALCAALCACSACGKQTVSLGSDVSKLAAGSAGVSGNGPLAGGGAPTAGLTGAGSGAGGSAGEPAPDDAGSDAAPTDAAIPDASQKLPCGEGHPACERGEICVHPEGTGCGPERTEGTCEPIPSDCMRQNDPVCGCDGVTYPNACAAALFDMLVDHEGSCEPEIEPCEGSVGCQPTEFCDRAGSCDGEGVCRALPETCGSEPRPVCGCDNVTHESICHAAARGVSAAYPGPCGGGGGPPTGMPCGGPDETSCPPGQFCDVTQAGCDEPDARGTCLYVPSFCYFFFSPVCGCDGITYENPCFAAAARTSLREPGPCP